MLQIGSAHILYQVILFFFFKQKTAYEMRISDWSSDVCSSDLRARSSTASAGTQPPTGLPGEHRNTSRAACRSASAATASRSIEKSSPPSRSGTSINGARCSRAHTAYIPNTGGVTSTRSEEHTSELQSLMRIPYAVFCWTK